MHFFNKTAQFFIVSSTSRDLYYFQPQIVKRYYQKGNILIHPDLNFIKFSTIEMWSTKIKSVYEVEKKKENLGIGEDRITEHFVYCEKTCDFLKFSKTKTKTLASRFQQSLCPPIKAKR